MAILQRQMQRRLKVVARLESHLSGLFPTRADIYLHPRSQSSLATPALSCPTESTPRCKPVSHFALGRRTLLTGSITPCTHLEARFKPFQVRSATLATASTSGRKPITSLRSPSHHTAARTWLDAFSRIPPDFKAKDPSYDGGNASAPGVSGGKVKGIPNDAYQITMSRSSGPGGQNVNKLSTKATLRMFLPPRNPQMTTSVDDSSLHETDEHDSGSDSRSEPEAQLKLWNGWLPWFVIPRLWASSHFASDPPSLLISSSETRQAHVNRSNAVQSLHALICSEADQLIINPTSKKQKDKVKRLMQQEGQRRRKAKEERKGKKVSRKKGAGAGWD